MSDRVRRLSQDNQIKQRRAWVLLGWVTAERSCPCKRSTCPAIGGGSEVLRYSSPTNLRSLQTNMTIYQESSLSHHQISDAPLKRRFGCSTVFSDRVSQHRRALICTPDETLRIPLQLECTTFCSLCVSDVETMRGVSWELLCYSLSTIFRSLMTNMIPDFRSRSAKASDFRCCT
ncbi:hypothetical protein J6590_011575 [Homalodisca vitripennis]|nr:hypothetical protein J6590_011575 [Homalodisca vitripennis]